MNVHVLMVNHPIAACRSPRTRGVYSVLLLCPSALCASHKHTRQTSFLRHFYSQQTSTAPPTLPAISRSRHATKSKQKHVRADSYSSVFRSSALPTRAVAAVHTLSPARSAVGSPIPPDRASRGLPNRHPHRHRCLQQSTHQRLRSATSPRLRAFHRRARDRCAEQSEASSSARRQPDRWR
nr:hypothetical protein CFP56_70254 [Quercus suber]